MNVASPNKNYIALETETFWKLGARATITTQIFSKRGLDYLGVTTEHESYKNKRDVDVYTQYEMLEAKVPIIFLGT
jgi:hypothetical protein